MPHLTYLVARSPYRLVVPTLLLAVCALAVGQVSDGSLSGCVLDPSGSPIPGATISLTRVDGIIVRTTVTDRVGFYRLQAVPPAAYSIEASALGFATTRHPEVQVPVGTTLQLDFQLALSSLEESVQVSATVPGISPQSSEVGFLLDQKRISTLPLNRRDFLQLSLLAPGVVGPVEESELSSRGAFAMHANGAREEYNAFFLDGVDNNDPYVNRYVLQAPVETIQEFKILTNSYSAAYGRSAGAQIDVITRRGGNQYRFALYEYFRNRALDARNFFDSAVKPKYIRNQFGFSAGGPIKKDRTHFFANVDLLREQRGLTRLGTVPTAEQRAGDLSGIGSTVLDPFTRQPFPGNRVPDSRISPVARSILNLFPTPNRTGLAGNYLAQPVLIENQAQVSFRVDHEFSPAQEIRVRYSRGEADLLEPYAEENQAIPGFGDVVDDRTNHFSAGYDQAFGSAFHALRFGYSELERSILPENYRVNVGQEWGVNWLGVRPRDQGYPALNIAGFSRVGDTTLLPIDRQSQTFHASDAWSTIVNGHALQFGGDLRHARMEGYLDLLTRGSLSFSGAVSGSGISDLLLGLPSFGLQSTADNPMALRTNIWSGYVQDDWKLRSDLTLNLGIRYDYVTPPQDPEDGMSALDLTTSRLVPVGTGSVSRSGIRADKNNFGPRLGLAWRPFSQVVLRGGFGVFYDSGMLTVHTAQYFNPPQFNLRVYFPTQTSLLTLYDPFPTSGGIAPPPTLNVLTPDLVGSHLQSWNLSVQSPIPGAGVLNVSYAASRGTHLIRSRDLNQALPGAGVVQMRRPLPQYGGILFVESSGSSEYHSLQAVLTRPLASHLATWTSYTWSKSIDDTSAFLHTRGDSNFPQDSHNTAAERGLSSFDTQHRLASAFVISFPETWKLLRETEFRGIITFQSGQPFTPVLRFDNSNTGNSGGTFGSDRPDRVSDGSLSDRSADRWFNTAAFVVPARYSFGTAGRNIVRGPGYTSLDISAARRFSLSENIRITAELQAFNALNRTNLDLPGLFVDEPLSFGRVFSAKAPRQIQLALRLAF